MSYFLSSKVLFGKGMLRRLGAELEGKGNKAVIITGKTMVKSSDSSQRLPGIVGQVASRLPVIKAHSRT